MLVSLGGVEGRGHQQPLKTVTFSPKIRRIARHLLFSLVASKNKIVLNDAYIPTFEYLSLKIEHA